MSKQAAAKTTPESRRTELKDQSALCAVLDEHASTMPRVTLRYAVERLDPALRTQYLAGRKAR